MTDFVRYNIEHVSSYSYTQPAKRCVMWLCLEPRTDFDQTLKGFQATTNPSSYLSAETDPFGNNKHVITLNLEHDSLEIVTKSQVEVVAGGQPPLGIGFGAWDEIEAWSNSFEYWHFTHESALTHRSPTLDAFIEKHSIKRGSDPLESLLQLSETLFHTFHYEPGITNVSSTVDHIIETGKGVCQDYAHVMLAIARSWGIPSRYVSGYMHVTGIADEQVPETQTHAWVECLLPNRGWLGFDPTNHTFADERHVRIAVGRDYLDVSPTRGVIIDGGPSTLTAAVKMNKSSLTD